MEYISFIYYYQKLKKKEIVTAPIEKFSNNINDTFMSKLRQIISFVVSVENSFGKIDT